MAVKNVPLTVILIIGCFITACGSNTAESMFSNTAEPISIDRTMLLGLPVHETAMFHFQVSFDNGNPSGGLTPADQGLLDRLDQDFTAWQDCIQQELHVTVDPTVAASFRYILVPMQFDCPFHPNWCGGEFHINDPVNYIILAIDTPVGGPLIYDWHEWMDVYFPQNNDQPSKCTRDL
jgi:hypothetical protein